MPCSLHIFSVVLMDSLTRPFRVSVKKATYAFSLLENCTNDNPLLQQVSLGLV